MFERILVPLDGSDFAESALAAAVELARCFHSKLFLIQVLPLDLSEVLPPAAETTEVEADVAKRRHDTDLQVANDYLTHRINQLVTAGIATEAVVREGGPAEAILSYAQEANISLIVISSHGRGGIDKLVMGSVADHILRHAPIPVLKIHALLPIA